MSTRSTFGNRRIPSIPDPEDGDDEISSTDINSQDNHGYTALMRAALYGNLLEVKSLLRNGANVGIQDNYGYTALMLAAINGYLEIVRELIRFVIDQEVYGPTSNSQLQSFLDIQNVDGGTALMGAANRDRLDIVRELLKAGASIDLWNRDGKTAYDLARSSQVRELLSKPWMASEQI